MTSTWLICSFVVVSVGYIQSQSANAIQEAYDLDEPPKLTVEDISKPVVSDTPDTATQVH